MHLSFLSFTVEQNSVRVMNFFFNIDIFSMFSVWMGESHALHLVDLTNMYVKQVCSLLWLTLLILIANCWAGGDQGFGMEVEKDLVITPIA